jgi:hypothetical protein
MKLPKFLNYKFLNNHKLFLGILLFIIVFSLFNNPIIEGFTANIGEYEFLAPPTDIISDEMFNKLIEKMKKVLNKPELTSNDKKSLKEYITNKEINYYVENGLFPISPYVQKYITNAWKEKYETEKKTNPNAVEPDYEKLIKQLPATLKLLPNRAIYVLTGGPAHDKALSPLPEGYLIYMGIKPPPSYSEPTSSINESTTSLTDSLPSLTDSNASLNEIDNKRNYNDLVSLCKKVR